MTKAQRGSVSLLLVLAVLAGSQAQPVSPATEEAGPPTRLLEEYAVSPEQAEALVALWSGEGAVEVGPDVAQRLDDAIFSPMPEELPGGLNLVDSILRTAVQQEDFGAVEALALNASADVNVRFENGSWPLMLALEQGNLPLAELLLSLGANPNMATQEGQTLLLMALQAGDQEVVALLLAYGADANKENSQGMAPLMVAIEAGDPGVVEELLAEGADSGKPDANGTTPLLAAIQSGNNATVQLLLEQNVDVNVPTSQGVTPLLVAVQDGDVPLVLELLDRGADTNLATSSNGTTPLLAALQSPSGADPANLDLLAALIAAGANVNRPDYNGVHPIQAAMEAGNLEAAALLRESGASLEPLTGEERAALERYMAGEQAPAPELEESLAGRGAAPAPEMEETMVEGEMAPAPEMEEPLMGGGLGGAQGEEVPAGMEPAAEQDLEDVESLVMSVLAGAPTLETVSELSAPMAEELEAVLAPVLETAQLGPEDGVEGGV